MLKDAVLKAFEKENDTSCSESMLIGCNEYYGLNLDKKTFLAASAFSAGMYAGEVCGAVSSSVAVLGVLFSNSRAHQSKEMQELIKDFHDKFKAELGTRLCSELKVKYNKKCEIMLGIAADLLEDIITKNNILNKENISKTI